MERYLEPLDIEVVICLDSMTVPEGKEKDMVEAFNNTSVEDLATTIRLTKSQKESLCKAQPVSRFWKIGDIQGIGIETYRKLFKFFYENNGVQLTLPL